MADLRVFAPAKINLTLHVTGRRADGYHLLDSLVVFADVGDEVHLRPATAVSLDVDGAEGAQVPAGEDNLVLRVARLFPDIAVALTLTKDLPVASGIGGGSADAAAVWRGLCRMAGQGGDASDLLALGADIPVCVPAQTARMQGIGDVVTPLEGLPEVHVVLANPRVAVSTPQIFKALIQKDNAPMPAALPDFADAAALCRWLATQRNDLQAPAEAIAPQIAQTRQALAALRGCLLARMSGSGATCFGVFASAGAASDGAAMLAAAQPGWWVRAGRMGSMKTAAEPQAVS
ncbi:4-(cytidine 5'-diphospho)-2-C-methyl-D-erythritol kinase [Pseudosulfitobacter sp. DSM 107133]|uniref:4-(cytidine 5'-diphospho)-2-C-methyl-D-erythritol kinase n=1 Tax=Pseudosulfitobacter sp. DSM 107133 TaxID=2883100 RepID=UPI000DF18B14|nr:4-(cytidine 5'-diphospho)-2-C-methyl-D-erythritol kinase [Pseudosulfitobacter sp. DSM 107133]UOA28120.1 4-diphosphocytidyl-2-C-methyl-D-erythritol kinase [Pseudosulfitobacter sp. DSM 107133]